MADMVAYLTIQAAAEDKKANDAMRTSEEQVENAEEGAELEAMENKAIEGLVGGLCSAATKGVGAGIGLGTADQVTTKVGASKHEDVGKLFDAATKGEDAATTGIVGFEDKNVAQHHMNAEHAREQAARLRDDGKQSQGLGDGALQVAREIKQTEDQTLLLTAQKA